MGHSLSRKAKETSTAEIAPLKIQQGSPPLPQAGSAKPNANMSTNGANSVASRGAAIAPNATSAAPLLGKVYGVTGGASGIGLATAKLIAQRGGTPCIADINPKAMEETKAYFEEQNLPFMMTTVDVSKRDQVDAWVESIVKEHGRLDGAANVAGVIGKGHGITAVADIEDSEWDKIIGVNLTGTMYCLRAQLRKIVDGGSIVNVSSIHGSKGFARHGCYDASKFGINGLTKSAALENGHREVRVNAVAPGSVYTPLMQSEWDFRGISKDDPFEVPTSFRRHGTVEETANVICFLLGPESTFVSGTVMAVDGAWQ